MSNCGCSSQKKVSKCCDSTLQAQIDSLAARVAANESAIATLAGRDDLLAGRIEDVVSAIEDGSEASLSGSAS